MNWFKVAGVIFAVIAICACADFLYAFVNDRWCRAFFDFWGGACALALSVILMMAATDIEKLHNWTDY